MTSTVLVRSAADADAALVAHSEEVLARHARSFRWGAVFLPGDARADAAVVYAFCRLADDSVDEAPSQDAARAALDALEAEVAGRAPARPIVAAALGVFARRQIPLAAAHDLLRGMRDDLAHGLAVPDDEALLVYCYRVAGTVGLMMRGIIGAVAPEAERPAIALGEAMQLTNICRDVAEDEVRGRIYLPATRLARHGGDRWPVVQELLALAEARYEEARAGMRWIPLRARVAIAVALRLYRAIGRRVLARGRPALLSRTVVPVHRKLGEALWALGEVALGGPRPPSGTSSPGQRP